MDLLRFNNFYIALKLFYVCLLCINDVSVDFTKRCCDWLIFSYLVMGQFMEQHNTWMPGYDAAINRTMKGDFAFISDRPILDYVSRQKEYCGKMKVTGG